MAAIVPEMHEATNALRHGFADLDPTTRPMVRWWWFGPDVSRAELKRELAAMAAGGFGGVEVSVVYPLSSVSDTYLSESFLADLRFAAECARAEGLRFDITLGSGWSFGGPHIDQSTAARRLRWDRHEVGPQSSKLTWTPSWPGQEFVAAYIGAGSIQEGPEEFERLAVHEDVLEIPQGKGPRVVLIATSELTGQQVKRAAAGAEGPVLDHYSAAAVQAHIDEVCEPLLRAIPAELIESVFCDSLEVYQADWTPSLPEEFTARRGYDPLGGLWLLDVVASDSARFRADYYSTLTELYENNFVVPLQQWSSRRGVEFRIQSYGEPPAQLSSYRYADRFEGEGWGWTSIPATKWASSAAALYGRSVVSSEVWTWVHSPSFAATPLDLKGEVHEHLLLGINHFIGHGWPYTSPQARGLGWYFYAAGALDDRNPWWPIMPEVTRYVQRLSWLLRQGKRLSDVGVYVPNRDVYAAITPGTPKALDLWAQVARHIGEEIPRALRTRGYDFELFDDVAAETLDPQAFTVVVLPWATDVPARTRRWLQRVEDAGGTVVDINNAFVIGELESLVAAATPPPLLIEEQTPTPSGQIGTVHRRVGDCDIYFVANTGAVPRDLRVTLRQQRASLERWEPESGQVLSATSGHEPARVRLAAYQAAVFVAHDGVLPSVAADGPSSPAVTHGLHESWTVQYDDGTPATAVTLPHCWEDDPGRAGYAGCASYRTTVEWDGNRTVVLDLGEPSPLEQVDTSRKGMRGNSFRARLASPVGVAAEVTVNGEFVGSLWQPPFEVRIDPHLRVGPNSLELKVHNTAAGAVAADSEIHRAVAVSHESYGKRFRMQDLEFAGDGLRSGLLTVPHLRAHPRAD